jgi:hypothetical protein
MKWQFARCAYLMRWKLRCAIRWKPLETRAARSLRDVAAQYAGSGKENLFHGLHKLIFYREDMHG